MLALTFLNVLLAIAPLIYHGLGKPSPHNVYPSDWISNEGNSGRNERRKEVGYHDEEGWVIIGPQDVTRDRERYDDSRRRDGYHDEWRYGDSRYDWESAVTYKNRTGGRYGDGRYTTYYNNQNNYDRGLNWNYGNGYYDSLSTTTVPFKYDWRYYNGSVDQDNKPIEGKNANIQSSTYVIGQDWWSRANSDTRWDNMTGDLWRDPRGPAANLTTTTTTTTTPKPNATTTPAP
ncbi:uncharacterized protein LOC135215511 [Macrobrachium nipponense]|uniref:uncharacterized protein LOC135215511 n=1 Tax=Macrobrachium nipponense TaxID=159736 RepID=UPI0030C86C1F